MSARPAVIIGAGLAGPCCARHPAAMCAWGQRHIKRLKTKKN